MTTQIYTVTLDDLVTYAVTVAADSPKHAESVARTVLFEEMSTLPEGLTIINRETDATAVFADTQPVRRFDVFGTYSIDFAVSVSATTSAQAERYAHRIYADEPMPFEHATGEERLRWNYAKEVVS